MPRQVTVIGAGVAGLVTATVLQKRGAAIRVVDRGSGLGPASCSWFAGGMLAPWCESEAAEQTVTDLGQVALRWWPRHYPSTEAAGTLVVAPPRDAADLTRFAARTAEHRWVDAEQIAALEPDLAGRFRNGLFFSREAHLDPRAALASLSAQLLEAGGHIDYRTTVEPENATGDVVVDCRGFAAASAIPDLRGVKGEMLLLRTREVTLTRPVRLLHPRIPVYIVPRTGGLFMVGATSIESDDRRRVTARSLIELLSAAYTLHPAFGEAEVVEIGTDVRPAFPDNLPRVVRDGRVIRLNGLFRHGFLLSPAFASRVADLIMGEADHTASVEAV